jgi:hypothetical protein
MSDLCRLIWCALIGLFRSRAALEAEILVLRHQLNVLRRKSPKRPTFSGIDRLVFAGLYRLAPGVLNALTIIKPETVIRWHRAGFRAYWRWKSRPYSGRPEAFGWEQAPRYIVRDRDRVYGNVFIRRLRAMGIRDRPTAPRSPWQNGHSERLIGSIRRDCLDHVVVFGELHLRHVLRSYAKYYNQARTHLSLNKDAPVSRAIQTIGRILPLPILGGLHHQYVRI